MTEEKKYIYPPEYFKAAKAKHKAKKILKKSNKDNLKQLVKKMKVAKPSD